jgi:glycosyltransferase involved in cell wall biosynthesis
VAGGAAVIAVLIPTLGRPTNVQRVIDNLEPTAPRNLIDPIFIVEAHDVETIAAITAIQRTYIVNTRSASYAGAINTAVLATTHDYLFIGSDDLNFYDGWAEPLLSLAKRYGMVGTNDLHNSDVLAGENATHYLVTRDYANLGTIDGSEPLLHEGYQHNYCDTEAVATAKHRGQFRPCMESVVEHLHWAWGLVGMDETYSKGARTVGADAALFASRAHLWT